MDMGYFGLKKPPFTCEINVDEMFQSFDIKEAQARLTHIQQHRGIFLLTGEPGAGKTSVLRRFVYQLNPQVYQQCYTPHASVSRSDFYRQLSNLLNLPAKTRKSDLFAQIQKAILDLYDHQGKIPCIVLDECQMMEPMALKEIALMTNFQMDSRLPFILIIAGQPDLRDILSRSIHEPLCQRISLSYHMAGLDEAETLTFIHHRLKVAGRSDPLFSDPACRLIHQMTYGLPRKIGNLCQSAMTLAMTQKLRTIEEQVIMKVKSGI